MIQSNNGYLSAAEAECARISAEAEEAGEERVKEHQQLRKAEERARERVNTPRMISWQHCINICKRLLLEGHVSYTTLEAIEFARSHSLHIITFQPHLHSQTATS